MKRGMIVAGLCAGMWLCGSVQGQETVVTNLLVTGTLRQDANSTASGDLSTALGFETSASAGASHAEGAGTVASGWASHAEGGGTLAEGENSHAEGMATEALAENSHAGGTYARVRAQDSNAFIHATGTSVTNCKESIYPDTAHFDHLVTLAPALNASNAVLSRAENDRRYLVVTNGVMGGELNMDENGIRNVAQIDWHGNGIDLESHLSTSADVWDGWNADMLDGYHAGAFVRKTNDTMTGDFSLAGSLILLPTQETVLNPGFQTDGDATIHWMTASGTYFKYGALGGDGDRFHFGSNGEFKAWGNVYSLADLVADRDLAVGGRGRVQYDPEIGTNQYALWVRNFGATYNDARGLLVTTPEYSGGAGIIFHAASKAGSSMASRFIVGTDGNVGVGVNDPQNKLHVAGDVRVSGNLLMLDGQNILSPNFNTNTWGSGFDAWGPNAYLKYGFVRELLVAQNAEFQSRVKIGTSSDYAQLNVGAPTGLVTATYAARFESAEGANSDKARGVLINFPNTTNPSSILFHAMSGAGPYTNSRVVIKADGKVGIGTSYPEATLHVHGDARFDGPIYGDGSGLTNIYLQDESDPVWTAASSSYATTSAVAAALSGYLPLIGGGSVSGIVATYYPPAGSYGAMLRENELHLFGSGGYFGFDYSADADGFSVFRRDDPSFPDMYKWTLWDNPWQNNYKPRWKGTIDSDEAIISNLVVDSATISGGTITAEEFTLAKTGATSVSFAYSTEWENYPVMQSGYSDIYFGIPGDPTLWFNYGAGTNIYFGDYDNRQNIRIIGDLHVEGNLYGDGAGLTNLPATGLTTNEADVRYVNTTGDTMTGALDLGRNMMTNVVGIYGPNSNTMCDLVIMAGGRTNGGSVGSGSLILSGGWTGYGETYAPVKVRSSLQVTQLEVDHIYGTYSGSTGNDLLIQAGSGSGSTNRGGVLCLAGGGGAYGATPGWIRLDSRMDANGHTISNAYYVGDGSGLTNVTATVDDSNYAKLDADNEFTGNIVVQGDVDVTGNGRFSAGIRVPQQGDISMGQYTNGTF